MNQADLAVGRKEVVKLLKQAAKVKTIIDENLSNKQIIKKYSTCFLAR